MTKRQLESKMRAFFHVHGDATAHRKIAREKEAEATTLWNDIVDVLDGSLAPGQLLHTYRGSFYRPPTGPIQVVETVDLDDLAGLEAEPRDEQGGPAVGPLVAAARASADVEEVAEF